MKTKYKIVEVYIKAGEKSVLLTVTDERSPEELIDHMTGSIQAFGCAVIDRSISNDLMVVSRKYLKSLMNKIDNGYEMRED